MILCRFGSIIRIFVLLFLGYGLCTEGVHVLVVEGLAGEAVEEVLATGVC